MLTFEFFAIVLLLVFAVFYISSNIVEPQEAASLLGQIFGR